MNCFHSMMGRTSATLPPSPATCPPRYKLFPECGRCGLSIVLIVKLGRIELVITPFSESGPDTLRKFNCSKYCRDASLKTLMVELSNEYVRPRRLNERRIG